MRFPLQARVILLVAGLNAALFTAGGVLLRDRFLSADGRVIEALIDQMEAVEFAVSGNIRPRGDLNVARMLAWDGWRIADDVILVDHSLRELADGTITADGVELNPLGSVQRGVDFDRQAVLRALQTVMRDDTSRQAAGGRAIPISAPGEPIVWGACWFAVESSLDLAGMFRSLVPWFLVSTLILTAGTFGLLHWIVLEPVAELAHGARRVQGGDFSTRLREPGRHDELAELVRSFNAMTATVGGFNKRLEEEVQKATALARRAEAEAMTQRRLAAMGELAAGIAHEINNPLGGLQNAVERLHRDDLPGDRRVQYLELLRSGLKRIETTVGRLLRFTPRQTEPEWLRLEDVLRDALELVRHRAERNGVELEVPNVADAPRLRGTRHELSQAILNLLVNSLDAIEEDPPSGEPGKISIEVEVDRTELALRVSDNGPGVQLEQLDKAADLFYTTKEVGKGTGLGLSIVHNIATAHGGRLRLSAREPRGLTVEILLPYGEGPA